MVQNDYSQVSAERYNIIVTRYKSFLDNLNDPTKPPVRVFDPLSEKFVKELELIREVSRDLQMKKEEDVTKAAQAAKLAEEEAAKREAEQKAAAEKKEEEKEENAQEKTGETPKADS